MTRGDAIGAMRSARPAHASDGRRATSSRPRASPACCPRRSRSSGSSRGRARDRRRARPWTPYGRRCRLSSRRRSTSFTGWTAIAPCARGPIATGHGDGRGDGMKRAIERGIRLLIVTNLTLVGAAARGRRRQLAAHDARPPGPASPSASPSPDLMSMGLAHIPTTHQLPPLPRHRRRGRASSRSRPSAIRSRAGGRARPATRASAWAGPRRATTGSPRTSASTATSRGPGGAGDHPAALRAAGPAVPRLPRRATPTCPTSMVGRNQDECWLCHKPTALSAAELPRTRTTRASTCRELPPVGARSASCRSTTPCATTRPACSATRSCGRRRRPPRPRRRPRPRPRRADRRAPIGARPAPSARWDARRPVTGCR